tara:strand:- start:6444 stop:10502 length:4059 start_codon:yes stop_codon:yes gene_type:complete
MSNNSKRVRTALLAGASTALITGLASAPAFAQSVSQTGTSTITAQQEFNDFSLPAPTQTLDGNTDGSVEVDIQNDDEANYALQNSTVTVGSSATTGNSTSATGYANSADLTVNADLNNVAGSGYSSLSASSAGDSLGATVGSATDIGVALTQQNINTAATVADATDIGVSIDNGADASTVTIAGNRQSATGVLNSGTTLVDASANNSSGSSGLGISQSSVNATLDVSVSSLAQFSTGSGTSGIGLNDSTAALTDNSQAATAVANSGSNTQAVSGNDLSLAANAAGAASAASSANANAAGGYATASNQELSGGNAVSIGATIDSAAGGYRASVVGDVAGSVLNNDRNSASALARGNEAANATTIDANSVTTPDTGTVAAVASSQKITGEVAINAGVTGAGADGPLVANVITDDVGTDSKVTASGNAVLASAAGNRGGNSINAEATTIDTVGADAGSATNDGATIADAAFAVASNQGVSSATSIAAGLVDDVATPTEGTSVSTAIGGSVVDSSVASLNNSLTASAAGNQTLTGGNAITLTGTNMATTAAVSSAQVMDGDLTSTIGSAGTPAVPAGNVTLTFSGTSTNAGGTFDFSGSTSDGGHTQDEVDALNTAYPANYTYTLNGDEIDVVTTGQATGISSYNFSYATGGSAGSPASGGVVVTVGNDITNSSVAVNGNATSGSAIGNSGTNRILADATNFANGTTAAGAADSVIDSSVVTASADMAVSNSQSVGATAVLASTVGSVFGITAEGATTPTLSDVSASTLSVSDNSESALVKGNEAGNSVRLSATNLSNSSALASNQQMDGDVVAEIADFSGAFATIGRDVTASTVQVDGNEISGTTFGNDVANTVAVLGSSTIAAGSTTLRAIADPSTTVDDEQSALADHSLANVQNVGTGTLQTTVEAGYGIATLGAGAPGADVDTSDVANSILSVSDNVQSAATTGNNAANAVNIAGGSITSNGALLSVQTSDAANVQAGSAMEVGAPAANTSSTLSLNGNANSASATVNAATNSMTVAADTSLVSRTTDAGLSGTPADDYVASADYVVNNFQQVGDTNVIASTTTVIANNDEGAFATDGIQQSIVDVIGNTAQATATSNRSVNSLALSANSSNASAGVLNQQASAADVTASAGTIAGTDVTGFADVSPINGSAATVANNATLARAGGNTTTNSLSAAATTFANVSGGAVTALNGAGSDAITASFAVLNEQTNSGAINAGVSVTYGTTFDAVGAAPSVMNSSSMVNGNSAATVAYGNAATNQVTFAALNSPAAAPGRTSAGIASNQLNTGDVGASTVALVGTTASGVGVAAGGAVSMSSVSVNGNALSASAFGNSSSNTLTISGNNVNVAPLIP